VAGIKTKSLIGFKPTAILGEWFTNPISVLKASLKKWGWKLDNLHPFLFHFISFFVKPANVNFSKRETE